MSPVYQQYHHQLLRAIRIQETREAPESDRVEACFKSSLDYWGKVRELAKGTGFKNKEEEIYFFKETKPWFTAYIEYFTYRYHALLFIPLDLFEKKRFWKWEERKMQRFYENNFAFCSYIREGATDRDTEYFLRSSRRRSRGPLSQEFIYDPDEEMATSHDHLVTIMGAYRLYKKYIQEEEEKLSGTIFLTK